MVAVVREQRPDLDVMRGFGRNPDAKPKLSLVLETSFVSNFALSSLK